MKQAKKPSPPTLPPTYELVFENEHGFTVHLPYQTEAAREAARLRYLEEGYHVENA